MKIDIKAVASWLSPVLLILGVFGISAASLSNNVREMWKSPSEIKVLKVIVAKQDSIIKDLTFRLKQQEHTDEMFFHFGRAMTDNENEESYVIETNGGRDVYEVDVRNTNEGYEMGFVFNLWRIYPIQYDPADENRMTVKLHDYKANESKDTKLILQQ